MITGRSQPQPPEQHAPEPVAPPVDLLDANTPHSTRQAWVGAQFGLSEAQSARLRGDTIEALVNDARQWSQRLWRERNVPQEGASGGFSTPPPPTPPSPEEAAAAHDQFLVGRYRAGQQNTSDWQ